MAEVQQSSKACGGMFNYLSFVRIVMFIGVAACGVIGTIHIYGIIAIAESKISSQNQVVAILALIFYLMTALVIILGIIDFGMIMKWAPILGSWIFLGLAMVYLAVLTLAFIQGQPLTQEQHDVMYYASLVLAGVGALFFLLGLCGGKNKKISQEASEG